MWFTQSVTQSSINFKASLCLKEAYIDQSSKDKLDIYGERVKLSLPIKTESDSRIKAYKLQGEIIHFLPGNAPEYLSSSTLRQFHTCYPPGVVSFHHQSGFDRLQVCTDLVNST